MRPPIVCAAILLCVAALAGSAVPARANVLGIHTMVQDNDEVDQQLNQAAELCGWGGWVKQLMYVQDGTEWGFDPKWTRFVDGARLRHLNVVARLHYIPPSYRADPGNFASKPKPDADASYTSYKDLIRSFVARFGGSLHYVEIWNEPNLSYEWNDAPSAEEFVRAMMAGCDGAREADPTVKVLFPGLAPTDGTPDGRNINNLDFLRACFQSTAVCPRDGKAFEDHFDILGNHSYAMNHPPSYRSDKYSVRGYTYELAICSAYGPARQTLITECGYALGSHEDAGYPAVTEDLRAQYMADAFRTVWATDNRVLGAMPYFLHAAERVSDRPFFWVRDDGSRTPQFDAVKALVPLLSDTPGNILNIYANRERGQFVDPVGIGDAVRVLQRALDPALAAVVPAYRVVTADVAPPGAPDGRLTVDDAARVLRFAAGLETPGP